MVVRRPRAVFVTETHVTGWLAMVWASFAVAPLKRFVIEFPFVAEKAVPTMRVGATGWLMPCIRNIVSRDASVRASYAVIACWSWSFRVVLNQ
jgi:hypothetical protein